MPVFDFNSTPDEKKPAECTYTVIRSNENEATAEKPMMVLDNKICQWDHHSCGVFTNPIKRTSFEFQQEDGTVSADILKIDARFVSLLKWLGENHINVRLSGENTEEGYAVYKIREIAFGGGTKLSAEDGFLQFMIERLLASNAPAEEVDDEDEDEAGDDMKLTSLQSITDFMNCAGRTLPDNIRLWARRNLAVARSHEVSPEERRHAQRALSIMMNVQWKSNYFEAIDPDEARRILDEELYGMERVKQRIIETIIQINRTHTLPAYGLLLVGPAGTGKSQIAYAVARILKLPWTTLDMSSINDPEQLTGSSRIYANAKTGIIMDAFAMAGESNLVFIINELDKAASGKGNGNPVFIYLDAFCRPEYFAEFLPDYQNLDELKAHYQRGGLGDVKVKKFLNNVMQAELAPIRARRQEWEKRIPDVFDILKEGSKAAEAKAAETLRDVKASMRINYFDDDSLIDTIED